MNGKIAGGEAMRYTSVHTKLCTATLLRQKSSTIACDLCFENRDGNRHNKVDDEGMLFQLRTVVKSTPGKGSN